MSLPTRLVRLRADLCRRAERMVPSSARTRMGQPLPDDLAQMVLVRLLAAYEDRGLEQFDDEKLYAFAYTTLHRIVVDEARRRVPELGRGEAPVEDALHSQPIECTDRERREACLQACMQEFEPEAQRFLILATDLESAPLAQRELGWPPGGASNACHRAKKLFRLLEACVQRRFRGEHA